MHPRFNPARDLHFFGLWPALALGLAGACAQPALAQQGSVGGDVVRPVQRVELHIEPTGTDDEEEATFTFRYQRPQPLGGGWQVNLRADLPFALNSKVTADNQAGDRDIGLGDVLLQAVFARHTSETEGFGIGTQFILPTAREEGFGKGKWRLRPTAGYRWSIPSISKETFFQTVVRYDFSFAGDPDRANVSELQFSPNLEIALPGKAYVSLFPSTDIRYNFIHDELFIPLNMEVGKQWGSLVTSLEGGVGLTNGEHRPYDWKLDARIGIRF